uniref:SAM domain-containing protein n=1 Tax=Lotharella oceanica TaxID=641309 RepID=A0A7S2U5G0_9EUKA
MEHVEADALTEADKVQAQAEFENLLNGQSPDIEKINWPLPQAPPPNWPANYSLREYMRWGRKEIAEYLDKLKIGHLKQTVLSYIQTGEQFMLINKKYITDHLGVTQPSDIARLLYGILWLIQSKAHWSGKYEIVPYLQEGEVRFREKQSEVETMRLPAEFSWDLWPVLLKHKVG